MKLFGVELKFNGFDVWHKGNFDPTTKANASHTHTKAQITDMPTKLSAFENDIGAGAGLKILPGTTEPAGLVTGDWWYEET